jgi:hypothetical protein
MIRRAHEDPARQVRWDLDPYGAGLVWIVEHPELSMNRMEEME